MKTSADDMEQTNLADSLPPVERHPLKPFIPENARMLMLGSFPPKREKWSMDFFYPNFNNDMWRIIGLAFFGDKSRFICADGKRFDREAVTDFCTERGIALFDTAYEVRRLKDNASDKFLEIVSPTDLNALLDMVPGSRAIVTTGQKAAETAAAALGCPVPPPGSFAGIGPDNMGLKTDNVPPVLWRMPSSSRAYPLSLEKKAAAYRLMFSTIYDDI